MEHDAIQPLIKSLLKVLIPGIENHHVFIGPLTSLNNNTPLFTRML